MMKSWISQLLIILIALQSVMAVADVHLEHESNSDHAVSDHQTASELTLHTEDTQSKASQTEDSQKETSSIDCNHCCHCHSPQFNFLGNLVTDPVFKDGEKHTIDLKNTAPFSLASQLFKPPRAHS